MYVVDEAGFLAAELGAPTTGTVNACSVGVTISCSALAGAVAHPHRCHRWEGRNRLGNHPVVGAGFGGGGATQLIK